MHEAIFTLIRTKHLTNTDKQQTFHYEYNSVVI